MGPQSAGSQPGPACYDQGGTVPTTTDANLVLGYLNAGALVGGRLPLHTAKAAPAIKAGLADPQHAPFAVSSTAQKPKPRHAQCPRCVASARQASSRGIGPPMKRDRGVA